MIVLPGECDGFIRQQAFDDAQRLCKARDARAWPLERQARLRIIVHDGSTAQAAFKASIGEDIEQSHIIGKQGGMPDIHVEDIAADA